MKMKTLLLMLLLVGSLQGFSQFGKKKKDKKQDEQAQVVDPRDGKIDSLTTANIMLTASLDSVTKNEILYYGLYTTIKEKILLKDFDPNRLGLIIDSIRAINGAPASLDGAQKLPVTTAVLTTTHDPSPSIRDSLSVMAKENKLLVMKADSLELAIHTMERNNMDKLRLVSELKDLKGLLDSKLISASDYETKKKLVMEKWQ
jgi:hypothetical protein